MLSIEDSRVLLKHSMCFFKNAFPGGVSYIEIVQLKDATRNEYINKSKKNISNNKLRDNSVCKKIRFKWLMLETIEKIFECTNKENLQDIDFALDNNFIELFTNYTNKNKMISYNMHDDLNK